MQTQLIRRTTIVSCLVMMTALALAGCGHKQEDAAGNVPSAGAPALAGTGSSPSLAGGSPAKVDESAQQQAAQRAAYFNSHPAGKGTGQNPGAAAPPYQGHP